MNIADIQRRDENVRRRVAFSHIPHMLNLRKSQRKQIYAVTTRSRKKKIRAYRVRAGFKFFRDMLAAAPRGVEMSGTREAEGGVG